MRESEFFEKEEICIERCPLDLGLSSVDELDLAYPAFLIYMFVVSNYLVS